MDVGRSNYNLLSRYCLWHFPLQTQKSHQ